MEYKVTIDNFDGPLDLLLHLIKESNISIFDISIEAITKQYLEYIKAMEHLNLNIASEYLTMAAELIEIKSSILLPKPVLADDEFSEDPKERLINRLLEYQKYKELTSTFKSLEELRKEIYTKEPSDMQGYLPDNSKAVSDLTVDDLINAFQLFLDRKQAEKPLPTKITGREYSIKERSNEIRNILRSKREVTFDELFDNYAKDYMIVSFLSILEMAKMQEIEIKQDQNFEQIYLVYKGRD